MHPKRQQRSDAGAGPVAVMVRLSQQQHDFISRRQDRNGKGVTYRSAALHRRHFRRQWMIATAGANSSRDKKRYPTLTAGTQQNHTMLMSWRRRRREEGGEEGRERYYSYSYE